MMKLGSGRKTNNTLLVMALLMPWGGPVLAERSEFQLGYVFDSWSSNFISSGQESRIPASFRFSSGDLRLSADTAFVMGDYEAAATDTSQASSFKSSQFSDSSLSENWLDLKLEAWLVSVAAAS
jgi:hypothetical protein